MTEPTADVDLKSLVGLHVLDAVDFSVEQVLNCSDCGRRWKPAKSG